MKRYSFAALITAGLALGSVATSILPAQAYPPHHMHHKIMVVKHRMHHKMVVIRHHAMVVHHHMMHH